MRAFEGRAKLRKTLQEIESSQISDKACQHANFQTFYSGLETAALTRVMAWETNLSQTGKQNEI